MSPERWRQVEQLYYAALEREEHERGEFLIQASAGDEELRREVDSLLAQDASRTGVLDRPAWEGRATGAETRTIGTPTPGSHIGPYRIETLLGEGGMGVVYRAWDTKLSRPVAIKFLSEELADAAARRRFQREARTASSLNHPHILTVYDAGEFEGQQYLVTEFVDAGSLQDWARRENPSWRQVVALLIGVADGLATAHAAGILHRDIKPGNILVASNGYAKLADFGLATLQESEVTAEASHPSRESLTRPGMILGTIPYLEKEPAERYQTMRDFVVDLKRALRLKTLEMPALERGSPETPALVGNTGGDGRWRCRLAGHRQYHAARSSHHRPGASADRSCGFGGRAGRLARWQDSSVCGRVWRAAPDLG